MTQNLPKNRAKTSGAGYNLLGERISGGIFNRMNAGAKLLATFILTLGLLAVKDWASALTVLTLEILALTLLGVGPLKLLGRFWPVLAASLITGWSTALVVEKTGDTLIHFSFIWVTTGSALTGLALMIRSLALLLPSLVLLASTDPTDLADSLTQTAKLPARFVLAALAALRLTGLLFTEWTALGQARRARGLGSGSGPLGRIKALTSRVFALLVQAIRQGNRLSITMEARGFGTGERSWARQDRHSSLDALLLLAVTLILATAYLLAATLGSLTFLWQ